MSMGKRRTKKQKREARHQFLVYWKKDLNNVIYEPKKGGFETNVKRQIERSSTKEIIKPEISISPEFSVQNEGWKYIKKDIIKSLSLLALILALELVIYFVWNSKLEVLGF